MKKLLPVLLALLLLTACRGMYPDDYVSVNEHDAPYAYRTTEAPTENAEPDAAKTAVMVSSAYDILTQIQELVLEGKESGQFLLENYSGDVLRNMEQMREKLCRDCPKYLYAMKGQDFRWSIQEDGAETYVNVEMKLRLTPEEIRDIKSRVLTSTAMGDIYKALSQQLTTFTIQLSGYQEETDFAALLDEYMLLHPDQIVEAPRVKVSVFPDSGSIRVVEFHFNYSVGSEELTHRKEQTDAYLELISDQLSWDMSSRETVDTLYKYLAPSSGYREIRNATVYSQVVLRAGSSRTMASVARYLCSLAGANCEIVEGTRDGETWYWNRIMTDGRWRSFDLHAAALAGELPALYRADEMEGYTYDETRYPETGLPEEPEPTEPDETTEPTDEPGLTP